MSRAGQRSGAGSRLGTGFVHQAVLLGARVFGDGGAPLGAPALDARPRPDPPGEMETVAARPPRRRLRRRRLERDRQHRRRAGRDGHRALLGVAASRLDRHEVRAWAHLSEVDGAGRARDLAPIEADAIRRSPLDVQLQPAGGGRWAGGRRDGRRRRAGVAAMGAGAAVGSCGVE